MAVITTRLGKGSELEWNEVDDNFTNLNTEVLANRADIDALIAEGITKFTSVDLLLEAKDVVGVDVSGGSILLTLPATPNQGDGVYIFCSNGSYSTNAMVVARNGSTIMDLAEDMTVSTDNVSFALIYSGTTWRVA